MVTQQLRRDVQQAIAPDIAHVTVKYGPQRACITVAKAAPSNVILRITRQLRAKGHKVDGPNLLMRTDDIYVEEAPDDPPQTADEAATDEAESDALLVQV